MARGNLGEKVFCNDKVWFVRLCEFMENEQEAKEQNGAEQPENGQDVDDHGTPPES